TPLTIAATWPCRRHQRSGVTHLHHGLSLILHRLKRDKLILYGIRIFFRIAQIGECMSSDNPDVGTTSICKVEPDRITVRGKNLADDRIGKTTYTAYFLFLLTGETPSENLVKLADAAMVSIAEHGFVPSIQ